MNGKLCGAAAAALIFAGSTAVGPPASGPEPPGWIAGDVHVHRSCGRAPIALPSLRGMMNVHDLNVISVLADIGNGEVQDPARDLPLVTGRDDAVSGRGRIVHWDAEWHWDATYAQYEHQALGGHLLLLGMTDEARPVWQEYTHPILEWGRRQGAVTGFAHMQYLDDDIPRTLNCCLPLEYPVEVALGAVDFVEEDVRGSDSAMRAYYRLLNCGFRPGLAAGTDYPCNNGAALGSLLTYVRAEGGPMTYRNWIAGIAKGRTVVSRKGHDEFLDLRVASTAAPGDELRLRGGSTIPVLVKWTSKGWAWGTIELIRDGLVVARRTSLVLPGGSATLSATVDFGRSGWLAARCVGRSGHRVHTAAVFVTVDDLPIRTSEADARFYVRWIESLLSRTSRGGEWSHYLTNQRAAAHDRYEAAKAVYTGIAREAADANARAQ
jgi:hypothetical protein